MLRSLANTIFRSWVPLLGYLVFLNFLSRQPSLPTPSFFGADKLMHLGSYSLLGYLWARGVRPLFPLSRMGLIWVAFWGCLLYGAFDEFVVQANIQGRHPEALDLVTDTLGGLLGGLVLIWWTGFRAPRIIR